MTGYHNGDGFFQVQLEVSEVSRSVWSSSYQGYSVKEGEAQSLPEREARELAESYEDCRHRGRQEEGGRRERHWHVLLLALLEETVREGPRDAEKPRETARTVET